MKYMQFAPAAEAVARLRSDLGATQEKVAREASMDQSRLSRIEKGEILAPEDIQRVLRALAALGSDDADGFMRFMERDWPFIGIGPPSYWNPQRDSLEKAGEMFAKIQSFLADGEQPWPLRRQVERRSKDLERVTAFLTNLKHDISFIGDIGVGKSTAISFVFELLVPAKAGERSINRPVLETGAGGTTICEVHIRSGPEFGISLLPMEGSDLTHLVSDFCAVKWASVRKERSEGPETPKVGREFERAIRNMSGLVRERKTSGGRTVYHDPIHDLVRRCKDEDELRERVFEFMDLPGRKTTDIWYSSTMGKHPTEWLRETFRAINNGRLPDVPLPRSISLIVPDFGKSFGEFEITVIDTKGVADVAVREDLDSRLRAPRSSVVFCCRFNDAPGMSSKALLEHMKQASSERFDTGKASILSLPRSDEALGMKDDMGDSALSDEEGYEFKRMQVESDLHAQDVPGVPTLFLNVEVDDAAKVRADLLEQIARMRHTISEQLLELCDAAAEIIENQEQHAVTAAIEAVAGRLNMFLTGNRKLGARERHAHKEALSTVRVVHASTLWASARRSGEYSSFNVVHQVGVGAAKDARLRSRDWFAKMEGQVNTLKAEAGLKPAARSIEQIQAVAEASRVAFLARAQLSAMEIYRKPLTRALVWAECAREWGKGPGFRNRVLQHLSNWFEEERPDLKETLDARMDVLWERSVITPLLQLAEQQDPEAESGADSGRAAEPQSTAPVRANEPSDAAST